MELDEAPDLGGALSLRPAVRSTRSSIVLAVERPRLVARRAALVLHRHADLRDRRLRLRPRDRGADGDRRRFAEVETGGFPDGLADRRRGRRVGRALGRVRRSPLHARRPARPRARATGRERTACAFGGATAVRSSSPPQRRTAGSMSPTSGSAGRPRTSFTRRRSGARRPPTPSRPARGSARTRRRRAASGGGRQPRAAPRSRRRRGRATATSPSTSIVIVSPSRTIASGPPRAASGDDVADHQPARRAGEAPVGDERDRLAEAGADDRRGDAEHLAHARAAGGALVADDEHVAGLRGARAHRVGARLLAVEDARRAGMAPPLSCRTP